MPHLVQTAARSRLSLSRPVVALVLFQKFLPLPSLSRSPSPHSAPRPPLGPSPFCRFPAPPRPLLGPLRAPGTARPSAPAAPARLWTPVPTLFRPRSRSAKPAATRASPRRSRSRRLRTMQQERAWRYCCFLQKAASRLCSFPPPLPLFPPRPPVRCSSAPAGIRPSASSLACPLPGSPPSAWPPRRAAAARRFCQAGWRFWWFVARFCPRGRRVCRRTRQPPARNSLSQPPRPHRAPAAARTRLAPSPPGPPNFSRTHFSAFPLLLRTLFSSVPPSPPSRR
mmetsp:Transcript_6767/g.16548  ORF Transcript_6767/g.16548 Transcript_6767/m.16548 type:complete len:282 (+) Transcript_6767:3862-4707(+)